MNFLILFFASYLLGSVPFGVIIAKAHGKDLRTIGSGNIGATNLSRAVGRKWGYFCFFLDVLKGLVPMLIASSMVSATPNIKELFIWLVIGCAAVLGHVFPVYLKFKGGKGVATSFGVALGLWPYYTLSAGFAIVTWVVFVLIWRYVSLASIAGAIAFPIALAVLIASLAGWEINNLWPLFIAAIGIPLMVIFRHRENIKRIIAGTEGKIFS